VAAREVRIMPVTPVELTSIEEIRRVVLRRARAADRLDWDLARTCYHDDATEDHGPLTGLALDVIRSLEQARTAAPSSVHLMTNILVDVDGDEASSESYCHAVVPAQAEAGEMHVYCRYLDRHERRGGEWRIVHRRVVVDAMSRVPATAVANHGYLVGSPDRHDPSYEPSAKG
jgi:hypothetical protein